MNDDLVLPPATAFLAVLNVADQDEGLFIHAVQTANWRVYLLPNSMQISIIIFYRRYSQIQRYLRSKF